MTKLDPGVFCTSRLLLLELLREEYPTRDQWRMIAACSATLMLNSIYQIAHGNHDGAAEGLDAICADMHAALAAAQQPDKGRLQ